MALKNELLAALQKDAGTYVSGEALAKTLNVTRAAVWKAVNALRKEGYDIISRTNNGYALMESDMLTTEILTAQLMDDTVKVAVFDSIDSTNNEAKRLLASDFEGKGLLAAAEQTAGRGRRGRTFYSPTKTGAYFSVIIPVQGENADFMTVTAAASVAAARAIERLTEKNVKIKWVNDLYLDNQKVCGILTEAVAEENVVRYVIVGIGINLTTKDFPSDVTQAGALQTGVPRSRLIAETTRELLSLTCPFRIDKFIPEYRARSLVLGKPVAFFDAEGEHHALARDIDDAGGLIVETESGEARTLRTGEITLSLM